MTIDIKIRKLLNVFQNGGKIFPVSFLLTAPLVKGGIVGILAVADMGRTDDKIKIIGIGVHRVFSQNLRLQSQLHAEENSDLSGIFFFQARQVVEIGVCVQQEDTARSLRGIGKVHVLVFREAHGLQPQGNSLPYHFLHGGIGVS